MFVERSTQYTSFSSRKQPANAGTERKQFTENASVALLMALQQPILTRAHTKCPPVLCDYSNRGHLDKVDHSDYRKVTVHSKKVGCGPITSLSPPPLSLPPSTPKKEDNRITVQIGVVRTIKTRWKQNKVTWKHDMYVVPIR